MCVRERALWECFCAEDLHWEYGLQFGCGNGYYIELGSVSFQLSPVINTPNNGPFFLHIQAINKKGTPLVLLIHINI